MPKVDKKAPPRDDSGGAFPFISKPDTNALKAHSHANEGITRPSPPPGSVERAGGLTYCDILIVGGEGRYRSAAVDGTRDITPLPLSRWVRAGRA